MNAGVPLTPLEIATAYIDRGWNPVPVPFKTKKPIDSGWQQRVIDHSNVEQHFDGKPQNVGVLMGPTSGGLTDVDLDCREAIEIAPFVLPETDALFGRTSSPSSHWLYVTTLAQAVEGATVQFQDPVRLKEKKPKTMLVEVRVGGKTGAQSVFPGSTHETGEAIRWEKAGEPAKIDDEELLTNARLIAAFCLLARYWPGEGSRHKAALAVGGFLGRAGYDAPYVKVFVESIARAAGDPEAKDRKQAAFDAAIAFAQGKKAQGFPAVKEFFGELVASKVAEWLHYDGGNAEEGVTEDGGEQDDIARLNKLHAVLPIGSKTRVVTFGELPDFPGLETIVMTQTVGDFTALQNKYRHSYRDKKGELQSQPPGTHWINSPKRRQYDSGMAFMPRHDGDAGNRLNLWRGFGVRPLKPAGSSGKAGCKKFLDFMFRIICSGDEANFDYLRKREATILQKRIRSEIALGLRTQEEGCGKGFYEATMRRLLGSHAMQINNPKHIVGAFNPHLETLLRLTADEALFVGSHEHRNALFGLITEDKLTIEPKGCSLYTADSFLNISITSNADHFLPVSGTARRFLIPTVSTERMKDFAYFDDLKAQLHDGGYEALLYHMLHEVDLKDFNVRDVPKTAGLMVQRHHSLSPLEAWWCELLETGTLMGADPTEPNCAVSNCYARQIEIKTKSAYGDTSTQIRHVTQLGVYDQARLVEPRLKHHTSDHRLGAFLSMMGCDNGKRVLRRRGWTFPPLFQCRQEWEKRYPGWKWRDSEVMEWRPEEADDDVEFGG
jgi:Bifunctional DNA primase/polymerase, N-terminal